MDNHENNLFRLWKPDHQVHILNWALSPLPDFILKLQPQPLIKSFIHKISNSKRRQVTLPLKTSVYFCVNVCKYMGRQ